MITVQEISRKKIRLEAPSAQDVIINKKLIFPSKIENIALVEKLVDEICNLFVVSEKIYGRIIVAITEAVSNGVLHGNKSNPHKTIEVICKTKNNCIYFSIKDQGTGFDFDNLPNPTDCDNIEKPDGRGVFLMKHLCDSIYFEDKGSKVILGFLLN